MPTDKRQGRTYGLVSSLVRIPSPRYRVLARIAPIRPSSGYDFYRNLYISLSEGCANDSYRGTTVKFSSSEAGFLSSEKHRLTAAF